MVKNILVLFLLVVLNGGCNTAQIRQSNNYYRIDNYIDLHVNLSQDTILLGGTISVTINYYNKSDTSFYFYPEALLYIDWYNPHGIFTGEPRSYYLSKYYNLDSLSLLKNHENYSRTYTVVLNEPLLHLGNNKLIVKYMCSSRIQENEQKQEYEILYGGLQSPIFEIYVKEK